MTPELTLKGAALARSLHLAPAFDALYVNNPKVACSSIKLTMQRAQLGDPDYDPKTTVHDRLNSPLTTAPEIVAEDAVSNTGFIFSFVRNPFGRLISAYLNKIVVPQKNGKLRQHAGFAADYCPTFPEFIAAVCEQTPDEMNPHWRLQALNLSVGRISYDFLGRLERFDEDWGEVAQRTGLPERVSKSGAQTKLWGKQRPVFDPISTRKVLAAYEADFETFGYGQTP